MDKDGDQYILQADQAQKAWSSADKLLQTAWQDAFQSASRGLPPSSFGRPRVFQSQSRSFAKGGQAEFEVQNVYEPLLVLKGKESLKENKVFPLEPAGF